ncbi:MAG: hypothetical protein HYX67_13565 [Candidatus Melainabacteria bacterium]|nr:hypothetical protein [Candidatus Melainabacteria bacterium]
MIDFLSLGVKVTLVICLVSLAVGFAFGLVASLDPTHPRTTKDLEVMFFELLGCAGLFLLLCLVFVILPMWCIGISVVLLVTAFSMLGQWFKAFFDRREGLPRQP